jgi:hypothetical protein
LSLCVAFSLFALGGCGIAQRIEAEKQAKELAERNAQLIEQSNAAIADCNTNFQKGNPKIQVARVKCLNDALSIRMATFGNDKDLVAAFMADRMVIAEKIQNGKMTFAEGDAASAQRWSQARIMITSLKEHRTLSTMFELTPERAWRGYGCAPLGRG